MNLPNKITMGRLVTAILILILLIFPWDQVGCSFPLFAINTNIKVNPKYIIAGVLFVLASISDFVDGYIARSRNLITNFGKVMDAIADKILVNGLLIILAYDGLIPVLIPVIIITRDTIVDSIKMLVGEKKGAVAASILGKIKTVCMMCGMTLILFYNLPFELIGFKLADILLYTGALLSVISGCEYYYKNKQTIFTEK